MAIIDTSTMLLNGVGSRFISIVLIPRSIAIPGIAAAGHTTPDVPQNSATWAVFKYSSDSVQIVCGIASPNHTTSGRNRPPQSHCGNSTGAPRVPVYANNLPHSQHRTRKMFPCISSTFLDPARRCRLSTFWVNSRNRSNRFSNSTRA